ncbi:glycosyltransferase [Solirubrobacter ginsenosidimutans]|uniref:Glycosyltransferase n=1 Tax=Solirubrobacter ginsenosidimutans TaxID=490573 RepID=A0A9X3MWA4_9ACTN|nr:glycosyltransferase [Solirubrobacter ginsenosidimutans]MDA0163864.1 glycosyltransferase [Solirubrobacter ginsenosidimutans]
MPPAKERLTVLKVADVEADANGGMTGFMLQSGAELTRGGHRVLYLFSRDILTERVPPVARRFVAPFAIALRCRALARRHPIDVVEIHESSAAVYCWLRKLLGGRGMPPCVVQSHGLDEPYWHALLARARAKGRRVSRKSRLSVPLTRLPQSRYALKHADAVIVLNSDDAAFLIERGRDPETVTIATTGVEPGFFAAPPPAAGGPLRAAFIGTWIDRKGVPELVEAWAETSRRFPDARLSVLGASVPETAVLDAFPQPARASVSVVPRFERAALRELLADHDAYVLPSWFEGMPLSTLEAAAAGLACVVSDARGHREIFGAAEPERAGALLVGAGDARSLATALGRLASDPALRADLGARARETARHFTWQRTAQQALRAYYRSLHRPRTGEHMTQAILHRPDLGWQRHRVVAAAGLRRPAAEHSEREAALLVKYGAGARCVVEIGVSEGGSAYELANVVAHDATLHLIDPYPKGRVGVSFSLVTARRLVGKASRKGVTVHWLRQLSTEAVRGWRAPIDFLFIDGDHAYDAVKRDWEEWTPFVAPDGHVVLHDALFMEHGWTDEDSGPVRLVRELGDTPPGFTRVNGADSTVVYRRTAVVGN